MVKSTKISFLLIAFLIVFNAIAEAQTKPFEDALKKASSDNKRVIVDVYTDWCGWCKKMDSEVYSTDAIKKLVDENFVFVKLNAEGTEKLKYNGKEYTETDLALLFQATGYPTNVFLEPDGKIIEFKYDKTKMINIPGYFKVSDYRKILEYIAAGKYKDTDLSTIVF